LPPLNFLNPSRSLQTSDQPTILLRVNQFEDFVSRGIGFIVNGSRSGNKADSLPRGGGFALIRRAGGVLIPPPKSSQTMEIEKKISGDSVELMLPGRIDGAAANQLEVEVLAAIKQGAKSIFVNLAASTFLCSAGIRVLLQYHRQMKSKGLILLVTRPSAEVASTLEMTGFPELVEK
jgi:anti-anti-sigma factor